MHMCERLHEGPYPLLANVFYGDYEAAVSNIMTRLYAQCQLFDLETPLVAGTVAEGPPPALTEQHRRKQHDGYRSSIRLVGCLFPARLGLLPGRSRRPAGARGRFTRRGSVAGRGAMLRTPKRTYSRYWVPRPR